MRFLRVDDSSTMRHTIINKLNKRSRLRCGNTPPWLRLPHGRRQLVEDPICKRLGLRSSVPGHAGGPETEDWTGYT
jgi:hypothetical protein